MEGSHDREDCSPVQPRPAQHEEECRESESDPFDDDDIGEDAVALP
jgi:hypothetical protein